MACDGGREEIEEGRSKTETARSYRSPWCMPRQTTRLRPTQHPTDPCFTTKVFTKMLSFQSTDKRTTVLGFLGMPWLETPPVGVISQVGWLSCFTVFS
eukprot:3526044-Rhodomonas_salina.1